MGVNYNPMTGKRTDLEVEPEDGAAAEKRHETWRLTRIAYLKEISLTASPFAQACYAIELARLET